VGTIAIGLVSGIGLGCVYALIAIAYNLVLSATGVFNLAQGAVVSAAIVTFFVLSQRLNLPVVVAFGATAAGGALVGSLIELVAVRRFLGRGGAISEDTVVSTLGFGLIVTSLGSLLFGGDSYSVGSYVSVQPIFVAGIPIRPLFIVMLIVSALVAAGFELFLQKTQTGLVTRAIIVDAEGAALLGVRVQHIAQLAFIVAGALAALAAFLIAPVTSASIFVGDSVALYGFAALSIGGFGSFRGALVGGLVVGLVAAMAQVFFQPEWSRPLIFAVLLGVLVVRPAGLFGSAGLFGARAAREV
jgi:branched-subunit amino acid ABC-type transport system permease component